MWLNFALPPCRWLDTHKHYKSDFQVGAHLLELYHAMVHEDNFIHKQVRLLAALIPPILSKAYAENSIHINAMKCMCQPDVGQDVSNWPSVEEGRG